MFWLQITKLLFTRKLLVSCIVFDRIYSVFYVITMQIRYTSILHNKPLAMDIMKTLIYMIILDASLCSKTSKTTELLKNLTTDYDVNLRPGLDSANQLIVNISLNLVALTKLNEVEGYISTVQFFDITWIDERIAWQPELYENVSYLSFRSVNVWTPELIIANPADQTYTFDDDRAIQQLWISLLAPWGCYINIM